MYFVIINTSGNTHTKQDFGSLSFYVISMLHFCCGENTHHFGCFISWFSSGGSSKVMHVKGKVPWCTILFTLYYFSLIIMHVSDHGVDYNFSLTSISVNTYTVQSYKSLWHVGPTLYWCCVQCIVSRTFYVYIKGVEHYTKSYSTIIA